MASWEDEIFGKISKADWLDVGAQPPTRPNDPVDTLFGDEKTDNLVARWQYIASEYGIPMMAQFHSFDTEAQTTVRVPIDSRNIEKGLIKVKINQSERLRALQRTGVTGEQALYDYVLNDGIRLADQVVTRTKVAKNELLATGKVTIKENNLDLTVDYGVTDEQKAFTVDLASTADVAGEIQSVLDAALEKGVTINGIVTSNTNLSKMRKNTKLMTAINGNIGAGSTIRVNALRDYLAEEFGITTVITNDFKYALPATKVDATGRPTITQKRYYPQDKITFFASNPNGRIGTGLWGDPPEVDLKNHSVSGSEVSPYVYITQKEEWDPAVLWTKASALFMPVLYNPSNIYIASAIDTGA